MNARTASSSWARLGASRPSVAMLDPSTITCLIFMASLHSTKRTGDSGGRPRYGAER